MDYCAPRGIAHSKFLGWSTEDQQKALEWMIHQNEKCPNCGSVPNDWIDEETKRPLDPPPFYATAVRCEGCATIRIGRQDVPEEERDGLYFHLTPERPPEQLEEEEDGPSDSS